MWEQLQRTDQRVSHAKAVAGGMQGVGVMAEKQCAIRARLLHMKMEMLQVPMM